jgi:hypothetical protein
MANYAVVTKVIVHNRRVDELDSVEGSYAKKISDYVEGLDSTSQAIISMNSVELSDGSVMTVIVHPS